MNVFCAVIWNVNVRNVVSACGGYDSGWKVNKNETCHVNDDWPIDDDGDARQRAVSRLESKCAERD